MKTITFERSLILALAAIGFCAAALAAPPANIPGTSQLRNASESSNRPVNREEALQQRDQLHQWLVSETLLHGLDNPAVANFSADELAEVDNARGEDPKRVGLTRSMSVNVGFSDLKMSRLNGRVLDRTNGAITRTQDGGFVFTMGLSSPGAAALRVHFTGFRLPPATGLYLYTEETQAFGPYTGRGPFGDGEFWSHTLVGDYVILQLRHVGPASDADLRATGFTVAGLGHVRPTFLDGTCANLDNASCTVSAECTVAKNDTAVSGARNAIAAMQWISGAFIYFCTGGLVADTDGSTQIPYFLTANHCRSKDRDARNLENFFQFKKADGCTGDCLTWQELRSTWDPSLRTLGAKVVSTGRGADYTLLQLAQPAPPDSVFLGWNADEIAFTNDVDLHRISHPGGAPQSYSTHIVDADATTCQSWPRGDRIYSRDVVGATEGGSSGSPVVNDAGEIVGQLSGACGTNVNNTCDKVNNRTVDGAFAAYYGTVSQWLDPSPGTCTPTSSTESDCSDGVDNDCDGLIDAADPDCQTGGLPPGSSCTSNSQCASNNCKGKPGFQTCK